MVKKQQEQEKPTVVKKQQELTVPTRRNMQRANSQILGLLSPDKNHNLSVMTKEECMQLIGQFETIRETLNDVRPIRRKLAALERTIESIKPCLLKCTDRYVNSCEIIDSLQGVMTSANDLMKDHSDEVMAACNEQAGVINIAFDEMKRIAQLSH